MNRNCAYCKTAFISKTGVNTYCSIKCRFLSKVKLSSKGGCWNWTGSHHGKGYGHFRYGGHVEKAHRAAYRILCGVIPPGISVFHKCDNPQCVNPQHLWLGTNLDNVLDRQQKERQSRGERHAGVKLTESDVIEIRSSWEPMKAFAKRKRLNSSTVRSAALGRSWRYLKISFNQENRSAGDKDF
jgi:HNH endonuclease